MKIQITKAHLKVIIPVFIALILIGFGAWVYTGVYKQQSEQPFLVRVADILQLPVARIGNHQVTYTNYLTHLDAQKVFLKGPTAQAQGLARELGTEDKVQAYERAIRIAAVDDMAEEAGVVITPLDVDRAFDELIAQSGTSTDIGEVRTFLQNEFGWDETQFKQLVVRPALVEDTLKQKQLTESQDALAFDTALAAKLSATSTKRYLTFE